MGFGNLVCSLQVYMQEYVPRAFLALSTTAHCRRLPAPGVHSPDSTGTLHIGAVPGPHLCGICHTG